MELRKLNAKIKSIGNKTAKWRDEVQLVLVGCAYHAFENGNLDPATRVVDALKGSDITAVIRWFEQNTPAIWLKSETKFRFNKSFNAEYDAVHLMATPWYELVKKPQEVSSVFDALDAVRNLISRIEREIEAGKKTVEHAEVLKELKAVAGKCATV